MTNRRTHKSYRIAVICALGFEMGAFRWMLDKEHNSLPQPANDDNAYILGELGGHNIVLTVLPGTQGKAAAQQVSKDLSRTFTEVRWRLLVGIGGGVPGRSRETGKLQLGDVVVASPDGVHCGVVQYDLGREEEGGFVLKGPLAPSPARLRSQIGVLSTSPRVRSNILEHVWTMINGLEQIDPDWAKLYQSPESDMYRQEYNRSGTFPKSDSARQKCIPRVHYGLIASGDSVIKSATTRDRICERLRHYGQVRCFEMEAAGLATDMSCTVIRGISDWADRHKNDDWQGYAAAVAAAYAKELILNMSPSAASELGSEPAGSSRGVAARGTSTAASSWAAEYTKYSNPVHSGRESHPRAHKERRLSKLEAPAEPGSSRQPYDYSEGTLPTGLPYAPADSAHTQDTHVHQYADYVYEPTYGAYENTDAGDGPYDPQPLSRYR